MTEQGASNSAAAAAGAGGGGGNRRIALMLAAAPVAVLLAVAAMTAMHNPAYDIPEGRLLSCYHNGPPPYPGHEDEVRAIVARGGEPGPINGTDEYVDYFTSNSRLTPNLSLRAIIYHAKTVPGYTGDSESLMKTVTSINRYEAPPGQCVWEHEYIAWGGSLLDLEYDRENKCYLSGNRTEVPALDAATIAMFRLGSYPAENSTWEPAPYELADEETRALIQRAGPAPSGTSAIEYVAQNTRGEVIRSASSVSFFADALHYTGGDAYRAVKKLNRHWLPGEGCVIEAFWVGWGNSLTDLRYSEESRCYLAPAEVRAKPLDTPCFP